VLSILDMLILAVFYKHAHNADMKLKECMTFVKELAIFCNFKSMLY